jgi:S-adenosylmethionine:tRNA ribosyltransferase-isomerase
MSIDPRSLRIADYTYDLPDERIARYPLSERDAAKLLVYRNRQIEENTFRRLSLYIPEDSLLVLNTAKVVRARMHFRKPTGGNIEIFCLEPHLQYADISTAMAKQKEVLWQCLVGGAAKWKEGMTLSLESGPITVYADLHARNKTDFTVRFHWTPTEYSWAEVLEAAGKIPLPPYLNREAEAADAETYQTLFAQHAGSVAAPTASLHFTPGVLDNIAGMGIKTAHVTLHVGAGTFKPVKSEVAGDHDMHAEWIEVSADTIAQLIAAMPNPVVAGGTTALRTLESLYWIGCKTAVNPTIDLQDLAISQWEVYQTHSTIPVKEALQALQRWISLQGQKKLITRTGIMIMPGYKFRIVDALLTNFHQPRSTLLLLVAAFIGSDWKAVYDYALANGFRFLSYGDASLLWRKNS